MNIECCSGDCRQGRDCPLRESRGIPGGGIVRAVLAVLLVGLCFAVAMGMAR